MTGKEWMDSHGLRVGDQVRIVKSDKGWDRWTDSMDRLIAEEVQILDKDDFCFDDDDEDTLIISNPFLPGFAFSIRHKCLAPLTAVTSWPAFFSKDVDVDIQIGKVCELAKTEPESKPKPEYADSPFPTLAEFLS